MYLKQIYAFWLNCILEEGGESLKFLTQAMYLKQCNAFKTNIFMILFLQENINC